ALASWSTLTSGARGRLWFRNVSTGPGNFAFQAIDSGLDCPSLTSLITTDLDGAGRRDVVVNIADPIPHPRATAVVLRNTSSGPGSISFADITTFQIFDSAVSPPLIAADFNA